jgi:hypothetical protein
MAQKHEIFGIMVRDPRDFTIPKTLGQIIIEDPFTGEKMWIDAEHCEKAYEQFNKEQISLLETVFINNRATLLTLNTGTEYMQPLLQFLKKKGARWK